MRAEGDPTFFAGQWGDPQIDRERACRLLQCTAEGLEELVARGLPRQGQGERERFGYCDVMNAGLYSGSGRSVAEIAERYIARTGEAGAEAWREPRHWCLTLQWTCDGDCRRGPEPTLPEPGGRVLRTEGWTYGDRGDGADGWLLDVDLAGTEEAVAAETLRGIYERHLGEMRGGTLRYQYLPPGLRGDAAAARRLGVVDCATTALMLQEACVAVGIPNRVRLGYLLGIVSIEHAWLEALDEGVWKPLDPVLAALVERSAAADVGEGPAEFCLGSAPNSLLPWPSGAASPLQPPGCEHPGAAYQLAARVQRVAVAATSTKEEQDR
jgi:hypothetical protein